MSKTIWQAGLPNNALSRHHDAPGSIFSLPSTSGSLFLPKGNLGAKMMLVTSQQMADFVNMTKRGFIKMVHELNIPFIRSGQQFYFDLASEVFPDFFQSIQLARSNHDLSPIYSLRDLAKKMHKNKRTVYSRLIEQDIKIYYSGIKVIVLLVDFNKLRLKMLKTRGK